MARALSKELAALAPARNTKNEKHTHLIFVWVTFELHQRAKYSTSHFRVFFFPLIFAQLLSSGWKSTSQLIGMLAVKLRCDLKSGQKLSLCCICSNLVKIGLTVCQYWDNFLIFLIKMLAVQQAAINSDPTTSVVRVSFFSKCIMTQNVLFVRFVCLPPSCPCLLWQSV